MELYFAPMSCSLATRIALYESGQEAGFHQVVLATKKTADGRDYFAINPKGQVPALVTDAGDVLTEGPAVLQYVADLAPGSGLAPPSGTMERTRLHQWLNYIASELHKAVYSMLFKPDIPAAMKDYARGSVGAKYDLLSAHLADRDYLVGDGFTVADGYLVTTLGWTQPAGIDLSPWPVLTAYRDRIMARPAVGRAFADEVALL
jgi:glutathione S-transferase